MSSDLKTSFDLEPNPFERSFATKEGEGNKGDGKLQQTRNSENGKSANSEQKSETNKHNLHIPNISALGNSINKAPSGASPLLTPGDRKLPPLGMSPGSQMTSGLGTPGSNLWNSLLNATNNPTNSGNNGSNTSNSNAGNANSIQNYSANGQSNNGTNPDGSFQQNNPNINQFISMLRKSGLTPNESNLRSGLTPGGINHNGGNGFPFNQLPGLTTPGAFLNGPITPGLSTLLGMSANQNNNQSSSTNNPGVLPPSNNSVANQEYAPHTMNTFDGIPHQHLQQHTPQVQTSQEVHQVQQVPRASQQAQSTEQASSEAEQAQHTQKTTALQTSNGTTLPQESEEKSGTKRKLRNNSDKSKKQKTENTALKAKRLKKEEAKEGDLNGSIDSPDSTSKKGSNEDSKRKSFLERNRVAASKCRQRKKQLIQKMEDELAFYSTGYRELSSQVTQLRDQLINLRGIVISHKDCPMLASSVGGFDQLNNIIQQSNYLTQMAADSQTNISSIPSTIPTTLNSHSGPMNSGQSVNSYMVQPNGQPRNIGQSPALPIHLTQGDRSSNASTTNPSTDTLNTNNSMNFPNQGQLNANITSHHSLTDLPAAATQNLSSSNHQSSSNSDLRAIHSMSNLAGMNSSEKLQNIGNSNFNLRPVNSMVDLNQQHLQQHALPPNQTFGNTMVDPVAVATRNMMGMTQPQS